MQALFCLYFPSALLSSSKEQQTVTVEKKKFVVTTSGKYLGIFWFIMHIHNPCLLILQW